jgi:hypothetical protein
MVMTSMKVLLMAFILGLLSGSYGLYLLLFTALAEEGGIGGIFVIVILITVGVFLLVPAKIYIIIKLTTNKKTK